MCPKIEPNFSHLCHFSHQYYIQPSHLREVHPPLLLACSILHLVCYPLLILSKVFNETLILCTSWNPINSTHCPLIVAGVPSSNSSIPQSPNLKSLVSSTLAGHDDIPKTQSHSASSKLWLSSCRNNCFECGFFSENQHLHSSESKGTTVCVCVYVFAIALHSACLHTLCKVLICVQNIWNQSYFLFQRCVFWETLKINMILKTFFIQEQTIVVTLYAGGIKLQYWFLVTHLSIALMYIQLLKVVSPPPARLPHLVHVAWASSIHSRKASWAAIQYQKATKQHSKTRWVHTWTSLNLFLNSCLPDFLSLFEQCECSKLYNLIWVWCVFLLWSWED